MTKTVNGPAAGTVDSRSTTRRVREHIVEIVSDSGEGAQKAGLDVCVQRVGSMITPFFTKGPVKTFADAVKSDTKRFGVWHAAMLARGQYWPPSQYEAAFISTAHTEAIVDATIKAAAESFEAAK